MTLDVLGQMESPSPVPVCLMVKKGLKIFLKKFLWNAFACVFNPHCVYFLLLSIFFRESFNLQRATEKHGL
jgi:hypothetical protein